MPKVVTNSQVSVPDEDTLVPWFLSVSLASSWSPCPSTWGTPAVSGVNVWLQERDLEALVRRFKTDLHNCVAYIQEPKLLKEKIRSLFEKYVQRADMVSSECPPCPSPPTLPCTSHLHSFAESPHPPGGNCGAELRPATGVCPPAGTPGEKPCHSQEEGGQRE